MNTVVKLDTRIKDIEVTDDSIIAHLVDGRTISVPFSLVMAIDRSRAKTAQAL